MSRYTQAVLGQLDRIFGRGTVAGLSEATLLERFVASRDETALTALVARHGPMVLGVCRRVLRDEHDVEDAFQATFLVLVRRAPAIRDGNRVGPWLHGVAHRVAVRARASSTRRNARELSGVAFTSEAPATSLADASQREFRSVLDDELAQLPEAMRAPLVLCYLEGLTHDEAAQRLGWPVGTVRSRMARARDRLRLRLARRGFAGDHAALPATLAAEPVSSALIDATVRASLSFPSSKAAALTSAAALAQGVLNAMMFAKLKVLGAAAVVCVVVITGVQTYAYQYGGMGRKAPTLDRPIPDQNDRHVALTRTIDAIRAELAESARRNDALQKRVDDLAGELDSLRAAPLAAAGKQNRLDAPGIAKSVKVAEPNKDELESRPVPASMWISQGQALMVISPEGNKATVFYPATKKALSQVLSEDSKTRHEVTPVVVPGLVSLSINGPRITRLAVFNEAQMDPVGGAGGGWYPVDLRETVDEAIPSAAPGSVVYVLGRRVYAFTSEAKRWDVLEFPEGTEPSPIVGPSSITCEHDGHIYTFDNKLGKWSDLDLRAILNSPADTSDAKPKVDTPR